MLDWLLYSILSEKQRERLANLFTEEQKNNIRQLIGFGKRNKQMKYIAHISDHLYSKGFTDRAYQELIQLLSTYEKDAFMQRLIHFELALWHANQINPKDAKKALQHLACANQGEKNKDQLRRLALLEAESYLLLDEREKAKNLLLERLNEDKHPDIYFGLANTEPTLPKRLEWINKVFLHYNLEEITFQTLTEKTTYDELQIQSVPRKVTDGPKVSIILPAYNAEKGIQIAIESILNQTYQNIELIIVDDCSTDGTLQVIKRYAKVDPRIKWDQTPQNSGPYVARNIGLIHATGEFVTVNDADDWSHAEKIERQVTHLIENPKIIANTSEHARLTEDLTLYRRGTRGRYLFPNMSSLMFRRKPVVDKLGFWDSVRFAADGEFKRRLLKEFGEDRFIDLETGPLSLPRQSVSSLTGSSAFGYNGFFMGARKEYVESLEHYHERAENLYYPYPLKERPFPVPNPMHPNRREVSYDFIIATDFRTLTRDQMKELKELTQTEGTFGFVQLYTYDLEIEHNLPAEVRSLIDGEKVHVIVYGEQVRTKKLFIINHQTLVDYQRYVPEIAAEETHVFITEDATRAEITQATENLRTYLQEEGIWHTLVPIQQDLMKLKNIQKLNKTLGSIRHYV